MTVMSHMFLRKTVLAIFTITFLVTGSGNKADASFLNEKPSVSRCVPASVPFINVKKPWKLNTKKCDQAKSQEYFMVFSEYGFSTTIPKNPSYDSRVKILKSLFSTFLRSYNSRNGWSKPFTGCDPIAEEIYYCKFDIYRRVNSTKQHQVGHVTAQFYGIPAWDIEFSIFIEVENILFGE